MSKEQTNNYSLTRGLGGLFIFASFQFLENDQFLWVLIALGVGIVNMIPYFWKSGWSSIFLYGVNVALSAITFYKFIQLDTRYIQWLWLIVMVYYIIRLRDLINRHRKARVIEQKENPIIH